MTQTKRQNRLNFLKLISIVGPHNYRQRRQRRGRNSDICIRRCFVWLQYALESGYNYTESRRNTEMNARDGCCHRKRSV